jgi:hypothetical protein
MVQARGTSAGAVDAVRMAVCGEAAPPFDAAQAETTSWVTEIITREAANQSLEDSIEKTG